VHELAIADSIVELANREADGRRVRAVGVSAGRQRQVVPGVLAFAFGHVAHGTPAEDAVLELRTVPGEDLLVERLELAEEPAR
jgi:Zn finger protein HypA/HybF involved in hydrogenase expression